MMWQRAITDGGVDIVVFTARVQLLHRLAVARDAGLELAARCGELLAQKQDAYALDEVGVR